MDPQSVYDAPSLNSMTITIDPLQSNLSNSDYGYSSNPAKKFSDIDPKLPVLLPSSMSIEPPKKNTLTINIHNDPDNSSPLQSSIQPDSQLSNDTDNRYTESSPTISSPNHSENPSSAVDVSNVESQIVTSSSSTSQDFPQPIIDDFQSDDPLSNSDLMLEDNSHVSRIDSDPHIHNSDYVSSSSFNSKFTVSELRYELLHM